MPRYRIHQIIADDDTYILPGTYFRKADARRALPTEAERCHPDDMRRKSGPDCIVVWRNGVYRASVSIEREE